MLEILLQATAEYMVAGIITIAIIVIAHAANKVRKLVENITGIDLAETEAYYIAQSLYRGRKEYDEIYTTTTEAVSKKLKQAGIKLPAEDIEAIITDTLAEIMEDDKK